jgi:ATPase subunit of ABC transporter with duplicated ATPase domains
MISFANVSKQYGKQVLFVEASFQLNPGEKAGLVGPNGAGKSTLFRMISGEEDADDGVINVPKKITIGTFKQEVDEMRGRPVLDEAIAGSGRLGDLHHELIELEHSMCHPERSEGPGREGHEESASSPAHPGPSLTLGMTNEQILARYGEVQEEYQHLGGYELEARAREVLHGLGFSHEMIDGDAGALSGGWKMRVSMAKVLLGNFDVLLLDEPTNHLDIESIVWLERFLKNVPATILMTSHDRDFMNRIVTKIIEIDDGDILTYSGDYDFYARERELRDANQEAAYARQQAKLAKEQRFIERFTAHAAKAAQVQSRIKMLEKQERVEPPKKRKLVKFDFRAPQRSGEDVVQLSGVQKSFGARTIYDGFDFHIRRGERWCVMGKNGAGKSTLLKMISGALAPDGGSVRLGASLKMGYFAQQSLDLLDPELTVWEQIQKDFPLEGIGVLRNLLGAFQFSGDDVDKKIRSLSGGEKSRLVLARMLLDPPNFLVLDEPTNHLDLATKEMLVDALKDFQGTMLFVSHDRTFLRGLSTRVLEISETPLTYGGSYVEYVESTGREAPGVHA